VFVVSAERVLELAEGGVLPQATPRAAGRRAPGLVLSGVSALGLGLRDGDVLLRVAGQPATDVSAVTAAVLEARRRGQRAIVADLERSVDGGWRQLQLVVEQPYP
jgi:S1-C subfamily serine protease